MLSKMFPLKMQNDSGTSILQCLSTVFFIMRLHLLLHKPVIYFLQC